MKFFKQSRAKSTGNIAQVKKDVTTSEILTEYTMNS